MHPHNKVQLNKLHPHQKIKKIEERKKNKFPSPHPRNSGLLLSSIYLFGPLLLIPPLLSEKAPGMYPSTAGETSMVDVLTGKGGPEEVPMRTLPPFEMLDYRFQTVSQFDIFGASVAPLVATKTRVLNHLKVSNTVMPTTSPGVSSEYGWRTPPCKGCSADHKGIDFVPGAGTPIFAVADGMVVDMGRNGGYGNFVKMSHLIANSEGVMEEWTTLYAHMKDDSFPKGMMIGSAMRSGEKIGAVGNTGMSTGPHLHFELLINGEHVDPLPLLGTHKIIIVSEKDYPDYMFVGEKFKVVETAVTYE